MKEPDITIPAAAVDQLLACADGTAALLWLYRLRCGDKCTETAAAELKCSAAELARAETLLRRLGLGAAPAKKPAADKPAPRLSEQTLPEYPAQDIVACETNDASFRALCQEVELALGRVLTTNDLRLLLGIYSHLGLPADVTLLLVQHCIDCYQRDHGAGRMPTMRYIEKEAWFWSDQELLTLERAEEHIRCERSRREQAAQVLEILQIRGRTPTKSERDYIGSWLALGFAPEAIALAYDRTVVSTGRLAWKYMDSILRSWDEKQLHTAAEIEQGDPRGSKGAAGKFPHRGGTAPEPQAQTQEQKEKNLAMMRKMYEQMNGGKGNGS